MAKGYAMLLGLLIAALIMGLMFLAISKIYFKRSSLNLTTEQQLNAPPNTNIKDYSQDVINKYQQKSQEDQTQDLNSGY